jgi:hypothetical protein
VGSSYTNNSSAARITDFDQESNMHSRLQRLAPLVAAVSSLILTGCGGGGGTSGATTAPANSSPQTYSVGGSVSGLNGTVVLHNNGGDELHIAASGSLSFATRLATGATYAVTVNASAGQQCSVASGSGTVAAADVTSVNIHCAPIPLKVSMEAV